MADTAPSYAHLLPPSWNTQVTAWLAEDTPSFDWGGFVVGESARDAHLFAKSSGLLAGVPFFDEVFQQMQCTVKWNYREGDWIDTSKGGKVVVATVRGPVRKLLLGERVALNTLARCSGIATASHLFLQQARKAGYKGYRCRYTKDDASAALPAVQGFRLVEKYGMLVGGVDMHRYDLSSMVMLKDNHIWSTGSITNAVVKARSVCGFSQRIDVEVQSYDEAVEAIEAGADVIMLDNMSGHQLVECARKLKHGYHVSSMRVARVGSSSSKAAAASMWIMWATVDHVDDAIDIISTSSIHQSTKHVDFSLKVDPASKASAAASSV